MMNTGKNFIYQTTVLLLSFCCVALFNILDINERCVSTFPLLPLLSCTRVRRNDDAMKYCSLLLKNSETKNTCSQIFSHYFQSLLESLSLVSDIAFLIYLLLTVYEKYTHEISH